VKESILLVEDDFLLREVIKEYLEIEEYSVGTAENAQEGLETFLVKPTEIVITDINMPGIINGIDVVRRIKAFRPNTKIIVCTGANNDLSSIENVAHQVLKKPFKLEDLKVILQKQSV
jgi:CheY-like chemotaxis protein